MKLLSAILLLAFPVISLAQAVTIESPPAGASIAQEESFTVQIARPVRISNQTFATRAHKLVLIL